MAGGHLGSIKCSLLIRGTMGQKIHPHRVKQKLLKLFISNFETYFVTLTD